MEPSTTSSIPAEQQHKRKWARKACLHCHNSHLSCADIRPCPRCIKKGITCIERTGESTRKKRRTNHKNLETPSSAPTPSIPPAAISKTPTDPEELRIMNILNENAAQFLAPVDSPPSFRPSTRLPSPPSSPISATSSSSSFISPTTATTTTATPAFPLDAVANGEFNVNSLPDFLVQDIYKSKAEELLSEITSLHSIMLQKVQLFNALNSHLSKPLITPPMQQIAILSRSVIANSNMTREERLDSFAQDVLLGSNHSVSIWDRKTMKLLRFNELCKARSALFSPNLIAVDAFFFDIGFMTGKEAAQVVIEMVDPFSAGTAPFVKKFMSNATFSLRGIPGVTLQHKVNIVVNEEFFAFIDMEPVLRMEPNPNSQQVDVDDQDVDDFTPTFASREMQHGITVSMVMCYEYQVNDLPVKKEHKACTFKRKLRNMIDYMKRLKVESGIK